MLQITPLGHSCFKLQDDGLTIITDPYDAQTGKLSSGLTADIITTSHEHHDHNAVDLIGGEPRVFDWPGEYEVGGVQIRGYSSFHDATGGADRGDNTIFVFCFSEATVAHLGDLGHELDSETIDNMGQIDILFIPVGGTYTIDAKIAKKVIDSIEPRIVIPMHYADDKIAIDGLAPVGEFLKIIGKTDLEAENILKIKRSDLPQEGMAVHLLQSK